MAKPQVLILQHADWEKPGRILECLDDVGLQTMTMNITGQAKPDLPEFSEIAGLVIMGGPMGATDYENYPGLKKEAKLARAAISVGKPVIGVCLGQQIIATALGAKLTSGAVDEVGFAPIKRLSQHDYFSMWSKQLNVLHWHHDVVGLPEGAEPLARSEQTKVQAFRIGSALAMQFHLEVSAPLLEEWLAEPTMVKGMKKSQIQKIRDDFNEYNTQLQPLADSVFSGFAARCATYAAYLEDGRH
ncbi:type 1 glutamine amidotransferase [Bifidobacterium psychraerophilum]|uniref:Glutamine amidotransferase class-I n=1 Tax=Bifidobacterium psychraerophilum TaxID=218140 RepID=A0A087CNH5_9BIFI|nr:type 1 glutamine amidotransferase [Bifidobacterium psychraerophilum]KFI84825.1 glutamine amidotransferase class-I [Bifidobacterium psychraerophilum]PKA94042.1 GMP synthase-like glutamine amidotransferase [Bifidobacterium psychraerophilum DSM 22366]